MVKSKNPDILTEYEQEQIINIFNTDISFASDFIKIY